MSPEEWPSIRSIARCVLPVLVGPSTAVTPAPGARSEPNVAWEGEKAMFYRGFCLTLRRFEVFCAADFKSANESGTKGARIADSSRHRFRSPQHLGTRCSGDTRSSLEGANKAWFAAAIP